MIAWGCGLPWLSYGDNFIKWLNRFMIVIMINIHYMCLGYYLWHCLMNGSKCGWIFYITNLIVFWYCLLISPLYVTFVFGAFTCSFPMGYICCSFRYCASFETSWCMAYFSYFLRILMTTLDIFRNQHVLEKPLHYFWT